MLVLQCVRELVREGDASSNVELLAAHGDLLLGRVVVGEHARLLEVAHRSEQVDTGRKEPDGAQLRLVPHDLGLVGIRELAPVHGHPLPELRVAEELDLDRSLELETAQLLDRVHDRHQPRVPFERRRGIGRNRMQ